MSAPTRIQLKRTKGWRKPEGAIVVARPSRWGNPFKALPTAEAWSVFCRIPIGLDIWIERVGIVSREVALAEAIDLYRIRIVNWANDEFDADDPVAEALAPLRGRDLACWCPLEDAAGRRMPCHADVLLQMANPEVSFPWM